VDSILKGPWQAAATPTTSRGTCGGTAVLLAVGPASAFQFRQPQPSVPVAAQSPTRLLLFPFVVLLQPLWHAALQPRRLCWL
jgi:hypothetical protein